MPVQQVWKCSFHVSIEDEQIVLSASAFRTFKPERQQPRFAFIAFHDSSCVRTPSSGEPSPTP
jgi:hypothetical protein